MRGDFTRSTFKKEKHFHDVRMQQGRVQMDADWNEQLDINAHRTETETKDVVGLCGAPIHHSGFHIVVNPAKELTAEEKALPENKDIPKLSGDDVYISGGRYYVDGILCENEHIVPFTKQPDCLPETDKIGKPKGAYLAYLDVWYRHLTALDEPEIREKALGGPDTATRAKTVWQVKLHNIGINKPNCLNVLPEWKKVVAPVTGMLAAKAEDSGKKEKPCVLTPEGGYRRLENQLYRVEIHRGEKLSNSKKDFITIKWSRDNGSIVTKWEEQDGDKLTVSSTGRDELLNFAKGQWVELTDDTRELSGKPGILVQLKEVEGLVLTIDTDTINDPDNSGAKSVDKSKFTGIAKIRRWDSKGIKGEITVDKPDQGFELEDGVFVKFSGGTYTTGDYWMIPARTVDADVEWPVDETNKKEPLMQLPHGIEHHYCPLALLNFDGKKWNVVSDCRRKFPPVTELTSLYYVGGDGQEAMPGKKLEHKLQVRVANGRIPVVGAKVKFTVSSGGGTLSDKKETTFAPDAIAECSWKLGTGGLQRVKAELLDAAGKPVPGQVVHFNAGLRMEVGGGGCAVTVGKGGQFKQLDVAIETLLEEGRTDICICMLPGEHDLSKGLKITGPENSDLSLKIEGCGPGTRIKIRVPWAMAYLNSFILRDVDITLDNKNDNPQPFMMVASKCRQVTIESCILTGSITRVLLGIEGTECVHIENNKINAYTGVSFNYAGIIFKSAGLKLPELFTILGPRDFYRESVKIVNNLSELNLEERQFIEDKISSSVEKMGDKLSLLERQSFSRFLQALTVSKADKTLLIERIWDISRAAASSTPGNALAILDGEANITLENNDITGVISLYGENSGLLLSDGYREKLAELNKNKKIVLSGLKGRLQVRNNRFTRMVLGDDMIKVIQKLIGARNVKLDNLFKVSFITDNLIEGKDNQWLSTHLGMTSNYFAMKDKEGDVGVAISNLAAFVGNQADNDFRLFSVSKKTEVAANIVVNIVVY